jgi:hypothetical protein
MRFVLSALFAFVVCNHLCAMDKPGCWADNTGRVSKRVSGFVVRVFPQHMRTGDGCHAQVIDSHKKVVFSASDHAFSIVLVGQDVNGDGVPDVVFEGYSGGAHCCWTYYVVSLGENSGLIKEFENQRGAGFRRNKSTGRVEIATMDGAFDYFDFLSHAETPFPDVYLRLDGKSLIDISKTYVRDYDHDITLAKTDIDRKSLAQFRSASSREAFTGDNSSRHTASAVLRIVFAYLYSGRQTQAHNTLRKMWPPFDQDRVWKLILETRRQGILGYTTR